MADTLISIDGKLTPLCEAGFHPENILGCNKVYSIINTLGHKPLHLSLKLRYALDSFEALYGVRPSLTAKEVAAEIYSLLHFGLYPEGGNTVCLTLEPTHDGGVRRQIFHRAITPYKGYGLLSVRPRATIAGYDLPFERHQTTISLTASQFTSHYAERTAQSTAIRASRQGVLLSSEDSPLVAVQGFKLLTAPIAEGGRNSAERELLFRLAHLAGLEIVEEAPLVEEIENYNEIFAMTPVGILSVYSVGDFTLENIYAHILSKQLKALTSEGLAL